MRPLDDFEKDLARQIIKNPHGALLANLLDKHLDGVLIRIEVSNRKAQVLISNSDVESFTIGGQLDSLYAKIISLVNLLKLLNKEKYIVIAQAAHHINDPFKFGRGIDDEERLPFEIPDENIINMLINYLNRNIYPTQALIDYVNHRFRTSEDIKHDRQINVTRIGILVTALIGLTGIFLNVHSLNINNKNVAISLESNKLRTGTALRQDERQIYEMTLKDSELMAFFADPSASDKPFEIADKYIQLLLNKKESATWKPKYNNWGNVENLLSILFQPTDFHNPAKVKLRKAFDMAEHLLYLLQDVHSAHKYKTINDEEYGTWVPYIDDTAANPLLLCALYFGHSSGYITKDFAQFIKDRIQKNECNRKIVSAIYSDILNPDWIDRIGKRQYDGVVKKAKHL